MAKGSQRSNTERFKYGICLNDECSQCKDKTIQQIPMRKEFVCGTCGKELRECPPPKKRNNKLPIIIGAAVVVIGGAVAAVTTLGGGSSDVIDTTPIDTTAVEAAPIDTTIAEAGDTATAEVCTASTPAPQPAPESTQKAKSQPNKVNLDYASYSGDSQNGAPHGNGTMTFRQSHIIPGTVDCQAAPGESVSGMWREGKINMGTWYRNDGNQVVVKLGQRYSR